jgi:N-acetylmuramoyl-L-alanine amidase
VRRKLSIILSLAALASVAFTSSNATALPPVMRGIDLPTVLSLHDRVRQFDYLLDDSSKRGELQKVRTIVLDPGHGGENQGAIGVAEIHEKYLTVELALSLRDELQRRYPNTRVVLTRYWDRELSLQDRIHFANTVKADLFLSLHYNAAVHDRAIGYEAYYLRVDETTPGLAQKKGEPVATVGGASGMEAKHLGGHEHGTFNDAVVTIQRDLARQRQHEESALLARTVVDQFRQRLSSVNRGVKQANFGVLRGALMPAIVVEGGFLTHPNEGERVVQEKHRERLIASLMAAIETFDKAVAE